MSSELRELGAALQRAIDRNNELEALNAELVEVLRQCDDAISWVLGGEPRDTALIAARNAARAALAKVEAGK